MQKIATPPTPPKGITKAQLAQLHVLLAQTNMLKQKETLVMAYSDGTAQSSKHLTAAQAMQLINYLKTLQPKVLQPKPAYVPNPQAQLMRRKIIAQFHNMGWHIANTNIIDMQRVNAWCSNYGYLKKPLNKYSVAELPTLVTQAYNAYNTHLKAF